MDLKTYAVHQKLVADSGLLAYVVDGRPVPIPLIEENFGGFLAPLADEKASRLITDYQGLIGDEIPVLMKRNPETGGYEISGEIPDTVIEAIELVHKVPADEVVRSLVNHNMVMVHGTEVEVLDISLSEQAERTRMAMDHLPKVVPVTEQPAEETGSGFFEEPAGEPPVRDVSGSPAAEPEMIPEMAEPEPAAEMAAGLEEEPLADTFGDGEPYFSDEELDEQPSDEESLGEKLLRIYDEVVAKIRALGLDQKLNLQM